jgi:hypothetical protein
MRGCNTAILNGCDILAATERVRHLDWRLPVAMVILSSIAQAAPCGAVIGLIPTTPDPIPDGGLLVDIVAEMAPSEELRCKLMVENPRRLYDASP